MLILTEGRAGFVASSVSLLTILILSTSGNRGQLWKIALFGLLLVIAIYMLISSGSVNQSLFTRLQGFSNITEDTNLLTRFRIWKLTLDPLLTNPQGVGFAYWVTTTGHSAHNELIEITLGSGFFGLSCYLLFFFVVIKNFIHGIKSVNRNTRIVCIAAMGCCVAYVINGIGDSPSVNNIWSWQVLWIVLASATGILRNAANRYPISNGSSTNAEE
jgi:O-antigen ligase